MCIRDRINEILNSAGISGLQQLQIVQMLERLPEKLAKYPMLDDFFIYFSQADKVLTSTGFYDAQLYYRANFRQEDGAYETWRELLGAQEEQGAYITHNEGILSRSDGMKHIVYALSLIHI